MKTGRIRTGIAWRLPLLLAWYPLAWLASVHLFVMRARLHLGFWPEPSRPDPKDLGFTFQHAAVGFGLATVPGAILTAVVLVVVLGGVGSGIGWRTQAWPALPLAAVSLAAVVAAGRPDPGRFFDGCMD